MGTRPAEGVTMEHTRKRGKRATGGCAVRRERRPEGPLRDGQQGGDARLPWGRAGARGEKRRPAGLGKSRTLGREGKLWGPRSPSSGPRDLWSGRGGGRPRGLRSGGNIDTGAGALLLENLVRKQDHGI